MGDQPPPDKAPAPTAVSRLDAFPHRFGGSYEGSSVSFDSRHGHCIFHLVLARSRQFYRIIRPGREPLGYQFRRNYRVRRVKPTLMKR